MAVLAVAVAALVLVAALLSVTGPSSTSFLSWRSARSASSLRPDADSPYRNTHPGVKYVGDEACARCHREIAESFRRHPMGRSLEPIERAASTGGDGREGRPLFEADGMEYSIERRDGVVYHQESHRDSSGQVVARVEGPVRYVLGSGRRGVSYLVDRDGYLVESPINWYARAGRWGLSPGYEVLNYHFDRPIQPGCLFCHSNQVTPAPDALNRYEPPIFRGHSIGCERCHGPGELHAAHPIQVDGEDPAIVNPADLKPSLRDAVCEQCHLAGAQRVERPGLRNEDFRPGLPLHRFWTVLMPASGPDAGKFVGQVEQMRASRCYQASQGALGCISCHDPHVLPAPEHRVDFFRGRCLECHATHGCRLPEASRRERQKDDDCTACHMPRSKSFDIPHVAMTDHRVLRRPESDGSQASAGHSMAASAGHSAGKRLLVPFHQSLMTAEERDDAKRELAIAYSRDGPDGAALALPWLEEALAERPDDVPAWQARGVALGWLRRPEEGLAAFQKALALAPSHELLLRESAQGAALAGKRDLALEYWQRAISVNPWRSDYRASLAQLYLENREWARAAEACRAALRLNPANLQVREWLVQSELSLGNQEAARGEMAILQSFRSAEAVSPPLPR
jgi:Tfp pilus assembly protein PilF